MHERQDDQDLDFDAEVKKAQQTREIIQADSNRVIERVMRVVCQDMAVVQPSQSQSSFCDIDKSELDRQDPLQESCQEKV